MEQYPLAEVLKSAESLKHEHRFGPPEGGYVRCWCGVIIDVVRTFGLHRIYPFN